MTRRTTTTLGVWLTSVIMLCAVPVAGQMPDPIFLAEPGLAVGTGPSFVATGDVNGDGKLDLVASNYDSDNVSVLLGNSDGTFGAAINSDAGLGAQGIALGHLDGDQHLDLVTANSDADSISVLLGNGDGSFTELSEPLLGDFPHQLALGLVNGDAQLDLVVASVRDSSIYYLEGNGDGTFDPAVAVLNDPTNAEWCQTVALGDLNQDNDLDIVSGNYRTNNISVLLGNGDGTFGTPAHYVTDETPGNIGGRVTIADLNKDQKPDLIIGNESSAEMAVLLNQGGGTFNDATASDRYPAGTHPVEIVAADFDADGNVDLAVCSYGTDDDVYVYPGLGDGTFDSLNVQTFDAGVNSWGMSGGMLDTETRIDLAVAAHGSDQVVVLLNQVLACTDADEDGYSVETEGCGPVDCDDSDPDVNPGATEICNGIDDDCDDVTDQVDDDNDGFLAEACGGDDCDDTDPDVHPGVFEAYPGDPVCMDGIDNNCNGYTDGEDAGCAEVAAWEASTMGAGDARNSRAANALFMIIIPVGAALLWKTRKNVR